MHVFVNWRRDGLQQIGCMHTRQGWNDGSGFSRRLRRLAGNGRNFPCARASLRRLHMCSNSTRTQNVCNARCSCTANVTLRDHRLVRTCAAVRKSHCRAMKDEGSAIYTYIFSCDGTYLFCTPRQWAAAASR